jgi:hypothetical protein
MIVSELVTFNLQTVSANLFHGFSVSSGAVVALALREKGGGTVMYSNEALVITLTHRRILT